MIIKTHSGSMYEIDDTKKRMRRLYGVKSPSQLQGNDGDWKEYDEISEVKVGQCVLVIWKDPAPGFIMPATRTSQVVEIDPDLKTEGN